MTSANVDGGRPGSAALRGTILLLVALALGVALLKGADRQDAFTSAGARPTATEEPEATLPATTTTTTPLRPAAEVKVLVLNGTGRQGLAKRTTDVLKPQGYNLLAPTDTSERATAAAVFHAPGYEREAAAVAEALGLPPTVSPVPVPPPVADTRGANVVVVVAGALADRVATGVGLTSVKKPTTTAAP